MDGEQKTTKTRSQTKKLLKNKKMVLMISRITTIITCLVGIILLYFCLSNLYQQLLSENKATGFFGIGNAIVVSESMKPDINANDLIFYKKEKIEIIEPGDIIVYKKQLNNDDEILVVHQLLSIDDDFAITKGINNEFPDEPFSTKSIVGIYLFKIPQAGKILDALTDAWGVAIIAFVLLIFLIGRVLFYYAKKKSMIAMISEKKETKNAIETFFDL